MPSDAGRANNGRCAAFQEHRGLLDIGADDFPSLPAPIVSASTMAIMFE